MAKGSREGEGRGSLSSSATSGREAMHGGRRQATLSGWRGDAAGGKWRKGDEGVTPGSIHP